MANRKFIFTLLSSVLIIFLVSCSTTKFVPEGQYLVERVKVKSTSEDVDPKSVKDYVKLTSNSRLFSLFKIPLRTYSLAGHDTAKWVNRFLHSIGEAPVLYDHRQMEETRKNLDIALMNKGYLKGYTQVDTLIKNRKISITYTLVPGEGYYVRNVKYDIKDSKIEQIIKSEIDEIRILHEGTPLDVDILDTERKRISSKLTNMGYYRFNKDFITYLVDTLAGSTLVDVTMQLDLYRANSRMEPIGHPVYTIGSINYTTDENKLNIRKSVLMENTVLKEGGLFEEDALQQTYNRFARLSAIKYTNISLKENDSLRTIDCDIQINTAKPSIISFQPEGTNTAGDLGVAVKAAYENRNLFHGSETFSIEPRFAYEHIKELKGYDGHHYEEYGIETKLSFPRFIMPFLSSRVKQSLLATSELAVSYNLQNRPEFHRRVFSGSWRYRWTNAAKNLSYKFDFLNLNFVSMPWISETFKKEYLEGETTKNAILKYNYENLFIMNLSFGMSFNNGIDAWKFNVESAGNLLTGLSAVFSAKKNADNQYMPFGIANAQYIKGDFDYVHNFHIDNNNSLVLHAGLGIAYPYGNSSILPFEKRYFSGGANSVRGWSVRGLGPGKYTSKDGNINFINQTGDMKLDLNAEFRTYLFWKFNGAIFVDAGNIWTLRDYADQPGGKFRFTSFLSEIAASYGLGLRLNFDYFILRFDVAMKAINPAYEKDDWHYPIIHPKFSRDFTFHFAVGMPF